MIKKIVGLLAMTFFMNAFIGNLLAAPSMLESFQEANRLYGDGKFNESIAAYQNALKSRPAAEIYYNLGNAYFKNKQLGQAIVNYERAKRLDPRDRDIRSNLLYANRLIEYKVDDKRSWLLRHITNLADYFKFQECWLLFLASLGLLLMGLLISFQRKHALFGKASTTLLCFTILTLFPLLLKFGETGMKGEAIVTSRQAEVRYGPSTVDRIAFRLVEGLKVTVDNHKQDWFRIRLRDGRSGWLRSDDITVI